MKLIFERSTPGRSTALIPDSDVPEVAPDFAVRAKAPRLPLFYRAYYITRAGKSNSSGAGFGGRCEKRAAAEEGLAIRACHSL